MGFESILAEINKLIREEDYDRAEKRIKTALGMTPPPNIQLEFYGYCSSYRNLKNSYTKIMKFFIKINGNKIFRKGWYEEENT